MFIKLDEEKIMGTYDEVVELSEVQQSFFRDRKRRGMGNQLFLENVFGKNYRSIYSDLRKLEMHYFEGLSTDICVFINTLDDEHDDVAEIMRMHYGFAENCDEFFSIGQIAEKLNCSYVDVSDALKLGYRLLQKSADGQLFERYIKMHDCDKLHRELSQCVSDRIDVFDQSDRGFFFNASFKTKPLFKKKNDETVEAQKSPVTSNSAKPIFEPNTVWRWEIYQVSLSDIKGSDRGGFNHCLIIQNNMGNNYSGTTTVLPITETYKKPSKVQVPIEDVLPVSSYILCDQVRTILKSRLMSKVCELDDKYKPLVEKALCQQLGLC